MAELTHKAFRSSFPYTLYRTPDGIVPFLAITQTSPEGVILCSSEKPEPDLALEVGSAPSVVQWAAGGRWSQSREGQMKVTKPFSWCLGGKNQARGLPPQCSPWEKLETRGERSYPQPSAEISFMPRLIKEKRGISP